jgi:hypothetical protein
MFPDESVLKRVSPIIKLLMISNELESFAKFQSKVKGSDPRFILSVFGELEILAQEFKLKKNINSKKNFFISLLV